MSKSSVPIDKRERWILMIKQIAWNTFKNTGSIDSYLELAKVEDIEKNMNKDKETKEINSIEKNIKKDIEL